jgi:hypothetical protein
VPGQPEKCSWTYFFGSVTVFLCQKRFVFSRMPTGGSVDQATFAVAI